MAEKPKLGKIIQLHQAYEGTNVCLYCKKPVKDWKPMETCPVKEIVSDIDSSELMNLKIQTYRS